MRANCEVWARWCERGPRRAKCSARAKRWSRLLGRRRGARALGLGAQARRCPREQPALASPAMASVAQTRAQRAQGTLLVLLLAASALAWLVTRNRMLGMDAGPGTDPGTLGFYVV